jgi:hypothetical protein
MIPKLYATCPAVRLKVHISNINTFKSVYYAYFHSIVKYGIIFWGLTFPTDCRILLYKRKSPELRLVHNSEPRLSFRIG